MDFLDVLDIIVIAMGLAAIMGLIDSGREDRKRRKK